MASCTALLWPFLLAIVLNATAYNPEVDGYKPPTCKAGEFKLSPHNSCKRFYECRNGRVRVKVCAMLQKFDRQHLKCKYTWNVKCKDIHPATQFTTPAPMTTRPPLSTTPSSETSTWLSTASSTTAAPGTQGTSTPGPSSESSTTSEPGSETTTTAAPGWQTSTTESGNESSTTAAPGTEGSSTPGPSSESSTTSEPGSETTTTAAPGWQTSTTESGNESSTTAAPGTEGSSTPGPSSESSTTSEPGFETTTTVPGTETSTVSGSSTTASSGYGSSTTEGSSTASWTGQASSTSTAEPVSKRSGSLDESTSVAPNTTALPPLPQCPATGWHRYPHPDCWKFYECLDGVLTDVSCYPLQNFDKATGRCNWRWKVDCHAKSVLPTLPHTEPRVPSFGYRPPKCPASGSKLFPHNDCWKFYDCQDGALTVQQCLPLQRFNRVKLACELSWKVDCDALPASSSGVEQPGAGGRSPVPPIPVCPATGSSTLAAETDCSKFWSCDRGHATLDSCGSLKRFSRQKKACEYLWTGVDCDTRRNELYFF